MGTRILIFFLFSILCFSACKKESESNPVDLKFSYFPLNIGQELIYSVTEINIDDTMDLFDTVRYELKERIDSMFIDNTGNKAWRLERFKRTNAASPWIIKDVWIAQVVNNQAQQVEENQRYVKIVFPPVEDKTWDGNVFNTQGTKMYEISSVDVPGSVNSFSYDSVLTVEQEKSETLIDKYHTFEQYANHVGLIHKEIISISYAQINPGVPIEQRIRRGHLYYQKLINVQKSQ